MDDLIAPGIILAYRRFQFLDLESRALRIGIAMNHPNNVGVIAFSLLGVDVELDLFAGA